MPRLVLVIAFDGGALSGWQAQPGASERTVQGEIESALARLLGGASRIAVHGAGRTDAGAHALAMVAHADVPRLPSSPRHRLNAVLPKDIRVLGAAVATRRFHARKSARGKRYVYRLHAAPAGNVLERHVTLHVRERLDVAAMRRAARFFEGERDFASLQSTGSSVATTTRRIDRCEWVGEPPDLRLVVEGTGFLRHMVRAIAGSLVMVGRGQRPAEWIPGMLASRDRTGCGPNAPAHALILDEIFYDAPWHELLQRARQGEDPARIRWSEDE